MPEREKVIKGLEAHATASGCAKNCPYWEEGKLDCSEKLAADAFALLKAQDNTICTKERCPMNAGTISDDCNITTCPWRTEGVEPKLSISGLEYECPVCKRHLIKYEDNYCRKCGRAVKWK